MTNDLISRAELRRSLMIWADKLRTAGECGGCEAELLQAVDGRRAGGGGRRTCAAWGVDT